MTYLRTTARAERCFVLALLLLHVPASLPFLAPNLGAAPTSRQDGLWPLERQVCRSRGPQHVDLRSTTACLLQQHNSQAEYTPAADKRTWLPALAAAVLLCSVGCPDEADAFYKSAGLDTSYRANTACEVILHKSLPGTSEGGSTCPGVFPKKISDTFVAKTAASIEDYQPRRWGALGPEIDLSQALPIISHKSTAEISMPVNMVLAFFASAFSTVLLHPVDTIKSRRQAHGGEGHQLAPGTDGPRLHGTSDGGSFSLAQVQSLYTGIGANLAREGPSNALYLAVFEQVKVAMFRNPATRHYAQSAPVVALLFAGAVGDATGCIFSMPAEIVKRRLQTGASTGCMQALRDAVSTEAALINTRAHIQSVLLRDIPEGALQIMLFETWRELAVESCPLLNCFGGQMLIGVLAGAIAAIVTTPMDVAATNLAAIKPGCSWQRRGKGHAEDGEKLILSDGEGGGCNPIVVMRDVVEREGWKGLMKGCGHRAAYYGPIAGIFFACFSMLQDLIVDEGRLQYLVASLTPVFHPWIFG